MTDTGPATSDLDVASELLVRAIPGVPSIEAGDDLGDIVTEALVRANTGLAAGDVVVVASKVVSRAEDCFVDLSAVIPSEAARSLGEEVEKDPRLVEVILRESRHVSRKSKGALIVVHRLGFVCANAGIDSSNAAPAHAELGSGPWVLTLPRDPDATARRLRGCIAQRFSVAPAVVITDSWGRPFRRGTVGFAIGVAGLPPVWDRRGATDRHGRRLEATESAVADSVAAAADLVAGQADEGRPVTLVRGLSFAERPSASEELLREPDHDLYV